MTEIDHFANKERIAAIIAASATLVDPNDETKLLVASAGRPNLDGIPIQLPGLYVTSSPVMETIRSGPEISDTLQELVHTVRYLIVFGVAGTEAGDSEEKLDDFQKQILELLEVDTTLSGVGSAVVDTSAPERVDHNVIKAAGDVVQLRQITLKCIVRTTG